MSERRTSSPRRTISSTREAALAERAAFTDGQILDAAELLFARHGLRGTRVREIASAAGLNEATLYNYYKNKEALYEAVLDRGIQPIVEIVRRSAGGANTLENIHEAAQQIITRLQQRPSVCQLLYLEAIADGEHLPRLVERWLRPFAQMITTGFGTRATRWQAQDFPQMVELMLHLSFGHFAIAPLMREVFGIDVRSEERVERQIHFIERLLGNLFADGALSTQPVDAGISIKHVKPRRKSNVTK
ncbi:MAG TPA: TetR/AcrR family transcriptional regulator [Rhodocyclaceae bacterium]|jgi:AcrR family transcriptional regulator|nr:TetR/AcrR family transcriptional regulator [Rhodocyclaceae bacterium]